MRLPITKLLHSALFHYLSGQGWLVLDCIMYSVGLSKVMHSRAPVQCWYSLLGKWKTDAVQYLDT